MKYTALQNFIRNNVYKTLPCVLLVFSQWTSFM